VGKVLAAEIRSNPECGAAGDDTADQFRRLGGDDAGLSVVLAVPKGSGLLLQIRIDPVINPGYPGGDDLARIVFAGNPEGVFRCQVDAFRIERVDQRIPGV